MNNTSAALLRMIISNNVIIITDLVSAPTIEYTAFS